MSEAQIPKAAARPSKARSGRKQLETKGNTVFERLRDDILWGELPVNAILSETDIADRYGASRSPVRYALARALEAGLVSVKARQGYVINVLSLKDAQEILFLRLVLEGTAVELACQSASSSDVEELTALAGTNLISDGRVDGKLLALTNRAFHLRIAEASGNARLAAMISNLLDRMLLLVAQVRDPVRAQAVRERHMAIAAAIAARDVGAGREAILAEFEADKERVVNVLWQMQQST